MSKPVSDVPPAQVLIVEDELISAMAFAAEFAAAGCQVIGPSARLSEVVPLTTKPDLAVIDHQLLDGTSDPIIEAPSVAGVPYLITRHLSTSDVPVLVKPVRTSTIVAAANRLRIAAGSNLQSDRAAG